MKKLDFRFAIIFICLAIVLFVATSAVFSCAVAYAEDGTDVIMAPVSDLTGNQYSSVSTLKVLAFGEYEAIYIPQSYYLTDPQPFGTDAGRYMVNYCGTTFILETDNLTTAKVSFADGVSPYPDVRIFLKENADVSITGVVITNDYTVKLLGYNQLGTKIYVRATLDNKNYYGFVDVNDVQTFNVPYHKIAQAERDAIIAQIPQPNPAAGDIIPNTSLALRIVLIIGIAVPAVLIAFLLFKPSKNSKRTVMNNQRNSEIDYDEPRQNNERRRR